MNHDSSSAATSLARSREPWFLRSRVRLYAVLALALAIPAVALFALVSIEVKSELRNQAATENSLVVSMVSRSVKEQFDGLKLYVRSYADRIKFSEAVCQQDTAFARLTLTQMIAGNPLVTRAFCADTTGVLWSDLPVDPSVFHANLSHRDWFAGLAEGRDVYLSEVYRRSALGQPYTIAVSGRVHDPSGTYCGILVAQVTVEDLSRWFLELPWPEYGDVALVDQRGHWVDNSGRGTDPRQVCDTTVFAAIVMQGSTSFEAPDPLTGVPSLINTATIPGSGWTVISRRPLSDVYGPVRAMQRTILFYFAVGLVGMLIIGGTLYRTLRRYHEERQSAVDGMQRAYRDVEERIHQRTADLVAANLELTRLADIIESTSVGIGSLSLDGIITSWNPAAERMYGYARSDVVGQPAAIFLPPDRADETADVLRRIAHGEQVAPFETQRLRKDGSAFHVSLAYSAVRNEHGDITGVSVVARDITRQKEMEIEARRLAADRAELLDRLQMTLDRMPIGCILNDTEFRFTYWNPAAEKIFGYTFAEVKGKHPFGTITPDSSQPHVASVFKRLAEEGCDIDAVGENMTKDGRRITCVWSNSSLRDRDGRFHGIISMCQDVTEKKKDEERMREYAAALARTNRELQDFAFVASHDLQEPLRKIAAFGERLKESAGDTLSEESREFLGRMLKAGQRMQVLIHDLLDFSRVSTRAQPFERTDLRAVACEVVSDLDARIEQTGGCVKIGELPVIDADPIQMRQLMQNLIANALKFHRPDAAPIVRLTSLTVPEGRCQIIVEDNGIGFDPKFVDRIFAPFQRLHGRHEFEGTGMGLAICRKIAERHHGAITATSTPGKGSSFIVTLPLNQSEAGRPVWTHGESPSASSWPMTTPTTAN